MKIELVTAYIVTESQRQKLTKAIAKQFPIVNTAPRWRAMEKGQDVVLPICKVNGKTLGSSHQWLYLVPDDEAGYVWVAAMQPEPGYARTITERGGYVDNPAAVPTAIL